MAIGGTEATEEEEAIEVMKEEETIEVEEDTIEVEEDTIEAEEDTIEVEEEIKKGLMKGLQRSKLLHFRIFLRAMMKINKPS